MEAYKPVYGVYLRCVVLQRLPSLYRIMRSCMIAATVETLSGDDRALCKLFWLSKKKKSVQVAITASIDCE